MNSVFEVFREGDLHGVSHRVADGDSNFVSWFVADRTRMVAVAGGKPVYAFSVAWKLIRAETARAQGVISSLCKEWKIPLVELSPVVVTFKILVDEKENDRIRLFVGMGVDSGVGATWLDEDLFKRKKVVVDEKTNQVILRSTRAAMRIDRATGLPLSAHARKAGTGDEIRMKRRPVEIQASAWPSRIQRVIASATSGVAALDPRREREIRSHLLYEGLMAIAGQSPDALVEPKRLTDAAERLAAVILGGESGRLDVSAMIAKRRVLAPSRADVRKHVTRTWVASQSRHDDSDIERSVSDEVEAALRRYARKHFDAAWPAGKKG